MSSQTFKITPSQDISGEIKMPGDKSISHRAVILSALSQGITTIANCSLGLDVLSAIDAMRALGVVIEKKEHIEVHGVGLHGLKPSKNPINCGNSGTLMRLLTGLLSAQQFDAVLVGDDSLMQRPMLRIAEPLRLMGAKIGLSPSNTAPIEITGNQKLQGIHYELLIPSAQVKSGILLAGLYAQGETLVKEKIKTRDHTEKMLENPPDSLRSSTPFFKGGDFKIPGDISAAAFFIVLATITKNADLIIREVGINPFRTGIIEILKRMGANIELFNHQFFGLEPVADIRVTYAPLRGIDIPQSLVANAIDEFPAIFIAAVCAQGNTVLRGAKELRIKESDRIAAMKNGFDQLGVKTIEYDDGLLIFGDQVFQGGRVDSMGDHRVAMAFAVAGHVAKNDISIDHCDFIKTSFPNFLELANLVGMKICL